jgi:hypothetical protein
VKPKYTNITETSCTCACGPAGNNASGNEVRVGQEIRPRKTAGAQHGVVRGHQPVKRLLPVELRIRILVCPLLPLLNAEE